MVIVNEDAFTQRNIEKAGYEANPRQDGSLSGFQVYAVPMTSMTLRATESLGIGKKEAERAKNMFALGLVSWMYGRPTEATIDWLEKKFGGKQEIFDANVAAFKAGYNFGETTELFAHSYLVAAAPAEPGTYRNIAGSTALAWGLIAGAERSGLPLFYASYPITPASELLHELSRHKNFGVITLQAEDEIAAANMALGAAFAGHLGVTGTSGPGMDLKAETIGLAVIMELPMIIVDVQRAGPSTGHADQDRAGRPAARDVRPPRRVADAHRRGVLAVGLLRRGDGGRADRRHGTARPVILLSDTFLSNSSEPWAPPRGRLAAEDRPGTSPTGRTRPGFLPYARDERLARPWAIRAPRASSTASAGSSARTAPATSATTREPRAHDAHPPRRRSPGSRRTSNPSRSTTPTATRSCSSWAGARRSARSAPWRGVCGGTAGRSRRRTCAISTRSRRTPARSSGATGRC